MAHGGTDIYFFRPQPVSHQLVLPEKDMGLVHFTLFTSKLLLVANTHRGTEFTFLQIFIIHLYFTNKQHKQTTEKKKMKKASE